MNKQTIHKTTTAIILLLTITVAVNLQAAIKPAEAQIANPDDFTGNIAMAHWSAYDSVHDVEVTVDAFYGQQTANGSSNYICIQAIHPEGTSETAEYLTKGVNWTTNHLHIEGMLCFTWVNGYELHTIVLDWYTSGLVEGDPIFWQNGSISFVQGAWASGSGDVVNATLLIDGGQHPHLGTLESDWAALGKIEPSPTLTPTAASPTATPNAAETPTPSPAPTVGSTETPVPTETSIAAPQVGGVSQEVIYIAIAVVALAVIVGFIAFETFRKR
jgi:Predicted solute binding protein